MTATEQPPTSPANPLAALKPRRVESGLLVAPDLAFLVGDCPEAEPPVEPPSQTSGAPINGTLVAVFIVSIWSRST